MGKCLLFVVIAFWLLFVLPWINVSNPAEGQKIGHIVKLSKEGVFNKTWEGELIRGGFTDGSGIMGQVFHFTVEDRRLVDIAKSCLEKDKEVVLHYRTELFSSRFRSEQGTPCFVDDIEVKN